MENQQIKTALYALIAETEDLQLLEEIEIMLVKNTKHDFWDSLPPSQKESIERGIEQALKGETTAHEDVMKKYEKWLIKYGGQRKPMKPLIRLSNTSKIAGQTVKLSIL